MDKSNPKWKGKGIAECSLRSERVPHRKIPGPASVVQEALHRKSEGEGVLVMTTQEAVHRALTVENEDTNFVDNPAWINVVKEGYLELAGYTDLVTVNKFPSFARVDLVVALVKSCGHTQSRSPWLHLKDPTSSVEASIHHKAYAEGDFAKKIKTGVCLVLRNIVLF
ncbi:hypothetical protein C3L33_23376, partial [Rhododendron williamsianum]